MNSRDFKIILIISFFIGFVLLSLFHSVFNYRLIFLAGNYSFFVTKSFLIGRFFQIMFIAFFSSCVISFFPLFYLVSKDWKKFLKEKYVDFLLTFSIILFGFAFFLFFINLVEVYFLPCFQNL